MTGMDGDADRLGVSEPWRGRRCSGEGDEARDDEEFATEGLLGRTAGS